jgi:hypothetical protein
MPQATDNTADDAARPTVTSMMRPLTQEGVGHDVPFAARHLLAAAVTA